MLGVLESDRFPLRYRKQSIAQGAEFSVYCQGNQLLFGLVYMGRLTGVIILEQLPLLDTPHLEKKHLFQFSLLSFGSGLS